MWTLLGLLAGVVFVGMFWGYGERKPEPPEEEIGAQAVGPTRPIIMNTMPGVPPVINPCRSITYQLTRWDLFTSFLTIFLRNRIIQVFLLAAMIFNGWLLLGRDLLTQPFSLTVIHGVIYIMGFLAVLVVVQSIMGLAMAFLPKQRGVVGQHVLEITEQGLIERTEFNEALAKWPSVCRIMSLCGYLFIYVSDNNYHQVPKRYFSPKEIGDFEAELRARAKRLKS